MKIRYIAFSLLLLFPAKDLFSQAKDKKQADKSTFGIYGQAFLYQSGLRLDVEKRMGKKSNGWIGFGAQYFNGLVNADGKSSLKTSSPAEDFYGDKMSGYGFALEHKIFVLPKKNIYFAYGPVFQQYSISYTDVAWHTVKRDGLEYLSYGTINGKQEISRFGATAVMGKKLLSDIESPTKLTFDIYAGLSYKSSTVKDSNPGSRDFTKGISNFGYSGIHPVYGFKLGFSFSK